MQNSTFVWAFWAFCVSFDWLWGHLDLQNWYRFASAPKEQLLELHRDKPEIMNPLIPQPPLLSRMSALNVFTQQMTKMSPRKNACRQNKHVHRCVVFCILGFHLIPPFVVLAKLIFGQRGGFNHTEPLRTSILRRILGQPQNPKTTQEDIFVVKNGQTRKHFLVEKCNFNFINFWGKGILLQAVLQWAKC